MKAQKVFLSRKREVAQYAEAYIFPRGRNNSPLWTILGDQVKFHRDQGMRNTSPPLPKVIHGRTQKRRQLLLLGWRKVSQSFTSVGWGAVHLWSSHGTVPATKLGALSSSQPLAILTTFISRSRSERLSLKTVPAKRKEEKV